MVAGVGVCRSGGGLATKLERLERSHRLARSEPSHLVTVGAVGASRKVSRLRFQISQIFKKQNPPTGEGSEFKGYLYK